MALGCWRAALAEDELAMTVEALKHRDATLHSHVKAAAKQGFQASAEQLQQAQEQIKQLRGGGERVARVTLRVAELEARCCVCCADGSQAQLGTALRQVDWVAQLLHSLLAQPPEVCAHELRSSRAAGGPDAAAEAASSAADHRRRAMRTAY